MWRWFARGVLYPIHETLRGRKTYQFLRRFRKVDRLDAAGLAEFRDARLQVLLRHAVAEVPYWRELFAENDLDLSRIRGAADLEQLPLMDKALIREQGERLVAESWRDRVIRLETGGSSGQPLIFFADKDRESAALASKARCRAWFGVQMGDCQMDLWGSPIELGASDRFRQWKDGLLNFRMLSAFELSDEKMAGFREALVDHRTDYVYGYASVLARYARFLAARNEDLRDLKLKVAVTTAETLFDDDREVIERVFACPVANEYGSRDGGFVAHECPQGSLHLLEDVCYVEILDETGKVLPEGELGEIAVTNLWSFGAPLIRYRLGDRARREAGDCSCGLPQPILGELGGRVSDTLLTPDGNRVHGLGVIYPIREHAGVDRFQVLQSRVEALELRVVPREGADPNAMRLELTEALSRVMGPGVDISVRFVDDIPPLPSGKRRSVICEVDESALGRG